MLWGCSRKRVKSVKVAAREKRNKAILVCAGVWNSANVSVFTETGHGERMGVVCCLGRRGSGRNKHRGGKLPEQRWG